MANRQRAGQLSRTLPSCAPFAALLAGLSLAEAHALPRIAAADWPTARLILIQDGAASSSQASRAAVAQPSQAPFAELNEALAAARARLEELSKAAEAAAAAGQARQELEAVKRENQRLQSELSGVRASRDELRDASQNDAARLAELTKAAEDAAAEANRIEDELVRLRWQNSQLNTSLARAEAAREQIEEDARAAQAALASKVETLSASAQGSAAEIARLRQELGTAEERLEAATRSQAEAAARFAEVQTALQEARARSSELEQQLAGLRGQTEELTAERDRAHRRVAEAESDAERLQSELSAVKEEVEAVTASRSKLETEVELLRTAASSAADAARQNLLAVEDRIRELNAALAGFEPAADQAMPVGAEDQVPPADPASSAVDDQASPARPGPATEREVPDPALRPELAAPVGEAALDDDLELIKSANAAAPVDEALLRLTSDVPLEMRLQVQGLLVDLGAKVEGGGVKMTVPGGVLFAINSDTIEPTAYDTLAKVAELIDAYDGRKVMIVGHTDSIGDEDYNEVLSQRRAELVKQFFVDNFEIESARLATDGRGEVQPIANNATVAGRQANRRVEVVILD